MPNSGKKVLCVITKEGHTRAMNMQSTDVNKALMSVATICDAGNTVMFKKDCTEAVKRRHDGGKHNVPHDREIPRVGFLRGRDEEQWTAHVRSFVCARKTDGDGSRWRGG